MLTPRENLLETINFGNPEYVPLFFEAYSVCGMSLFPEVEMPWESGVDPFGIPWKANALGSMPDTTVAPQLEDIADWKEVVKIPDIDHVDFEGVAKEELKNVDRNQQAVVIMHGVGIFERLVSFMGYEEALMSLLTDPESCMEFFDAVTDYKIKVANRMIDAYHPDVYCPADDIASAQNLFMSPQVYREVIKPYHAKLAKAITDRGVILSWHTCGKCEAVLEDYVDMGVKIWTSAQIMNDIPGIQKRFKGRLVVEGGWDSSGLPGFISATEDDIRTEVRRTIEEYGKNGGFILNPTLVNEKGNALLVGDDRMPALFDEWGKYKNFR